jgi:SH3 domain protein
MKPLVTLSLWLLAVAVVNAQDVRYVTDSLKLEARSGPGTSNRIVRMLQSGTRVRVLERRNGWSRVDLDGREGWILSRFLMDRPSARNQVAEAVAARDAAQSGEAEAREQLSRATSSVTALEEERDALANRLESLADELAQLKRTASSAVAIQTENQRLKTRSSAMTADLEALREELLVLRRRQEREWFVAGAGVLLGGMLLGLVIPKIRWKRRRGWSEL